ncbi:alanine--tRNA ligase [Rubinisphaera sp.]|uniref:alanine--tRNA ligase n=1 Tax=Rubinisphaera sp. TaxID=2024857 RepID=UPI000C0E83F7|nr:alanine--tRNA ligase [Rubinisphaera sp.]MBV08939.1 alanine--tRNA ligase [Rubinisphaera sp.]HCS51723.1 alanine--tRNA ligase [Planctomycetaceae bacterium]|tara:strand:+ start:11101 stop:13713 length:2613 start_codon:yes stop_codon:yes gene_type:complete
MNTDDLRDAYLDFFTEKGCVRRPSDVLVPNDPTVLFTPAGMNQFKNQFLGIGQLEFSKATTCQKCLRTGDISNVGVTAYHHTFFEMLGNFSFGDYFKKEAIHWAWEFLTTKKWLGLDPERLTVTVYLDDDEAFNIWEKEIGLDPKRISREDEYENFWPAGAPTDGPDGVCGPCSEIYYHPPGGGKCVEIWNLVFTQFNRVGSPPDNLRPLPMKNIDTGMGLERTASTLQGVESNFEIDTLKPLCETVGEVLGSKYTYAGEHGRAMRRIADHVRAVTMCVHENVLPDNKEQGYVVRQLLRRAVLESYLIGKQEPVLHTLVPKVVEMLSKPYPELKETTQSVQEAIREEESAFLDTIERGLNRFNKCLDNAKSSGVIPGEEAFHLHTTDGFLYELTEALAAKHNLKVDRSGFETLMEEHGIISNAGKQKSVMAEGPLDAIRKTSGNTEFLGYDSTEATAKVVGIIAEKQLVEELNEVGHKDLVAIVLDRTPFYAESGGQVGDVGSLTAEGIEFDVQDTQKDGELWLHIGHLKKGKIGIDQELVATVDADRRDGISRAHSATHIMHHALRTTLGEGATQRGSKVQQDELRFDFAHKRPLTAEELTVIEDIVNTYISEGASVSTKMLPIAEAREAGAMALFGEKYPDFVRVVSMGDFSKELCGGIHLTNTGQVGMFKVIAEEPVAKGVRRLVAYTGEKAISEVRAKEAVLKEVMSELKVGSTDEVVRKIQQLQNDLKDAKRKLSDQMRQSIGDDVNDLLAKAEKIGDVSLIAHQLDNVDKDVLRDYADRLRKKTKAVVILATEIDGRVALLAGVTSELTKQGINASNCVKAAAKLVQGGGGGRPDLAEAGGKDPAGISKALEAGLQYYREQLQK